MENNWGGTTFEFNFGPNYKHITLKLLYEICAFLVIWSQEFAFLTKKKNLKSIVILQYLIWSPISWTKKCFFYKYFWNVFFLQVLQVKKKKHFKSIKTKYFKKCYWFRVAHKHKPTNIFFLIIKLAFLKNQEIISSTLNHISIIKPRNFN